MRFEPSCFACVLGIDSVSLKVVVPQVEVHRVARRRDLSPQLVGRETDRVNVLTLLTLKMRVAVGKEIDTVISNDDAYLAAEPKWVPRERGIA